MMDTRLRAVCFWIAVFAGVVALAAIGSTVIRRIVFPATVFVGATAVILFLRMLFSPTYRQGVKALNRAMQGDEPSPGRPIGFGDPDWGLFGRQCGSPALLWLRAILTIGLLPIGLLQNWIGLEIVLLWFAGAFVAMELSMMHGALSQTGR